MKPSALGRVVMALLLTIGVGCNVIYLNNTEKEEEEIVYTEKLFDASIYKKEVKEENKETATEEVVEERIEVFDGLTMDELTDKLNRTLSNNLSGMGNAFAKYSVELGVDPYLAVAISMHETGCTWNCSYILQACNNVGGQKGEGCNGYKAYDTLEEGIYGFIANIKTNYVDYGLMTAEEMNPKYAEDPMWSSKVNNYIEKIKNN